MWFTFNYDKRKFLNFKMAVPKKRTSISKKRIRKKIWKGKGSRSALKALALGKSLSTGKSKSFFFQQTNK
uniref:ribosomal protein L32 n=1 Tax=Cyananthus lobatus TaxID=28490 RepID=UPI002027EB6F|nr:ribosomal protein L32 [Cyananthus lobatus]UPX07718.1 ribosomal protein L32 [Cyananthus lobatus]